MKLVETVQTIRYAVGAPVIINSGVTVRNAKQKVGGVDSSSHLTGYAADIRTEGWSKAKLGALIKQLHSAGKLPHLKYCYLIADSARAVHMDVDAGKKRSRVFGF